MAGFRPLYNKVLVRPDDAVAASAGGIVFPDNAQEKATRGTVIAVGAGRITESGTVIPFDIKAGDKVLYTKYAGTEIEIERTKHVILADEEVIGKFE